MSLFDTYIKVDYRRLLPSSSPEGADPEADLGIYDDDESQAQRRASEEITCPAWCDALPSLSFRERLLGCLTCMVCGYLLGLGSIMRLKQLLTGNPTPLVINVTVGNLLSICGTCFLTGPQQQAQRMFHKTRKIASVVYLAVMAITLLSLLVPRFPGLGFLLLLLLLAQYAAITWYCLTYIPFARDILKKCCRRMIRAPGGPIEEEEVLF